MPGYGVGFGLGGSEQIGQLGFLHVGREISWQARVCFALGGWETEMLAGRRRRKRRAVGGKLGNELVLPLSLSGFAGRFASCAALFSPAFCSVLSVKSPRTCVCVLSHKSRLCSQRPSSRPQEPAALLPVSRTAQTQRAQTLAGSRRCFSWHSRTDRAREHPGGVQAASFKLQDRNELVLWLCFLLLSPSRAFCSALTHPSCPWAAPLSSEGSFSLQKSRCVRASL